MGIIKKAFRFMVKVFSTLQCAAHASVFVTVCTSGSQQNVETPRPSNQLTELLEDEKIEDASRSNLVVIVAGNLVPMEA